MEKLHTARLNKHKRQGRFLLISNLNGEFPQNIMGKCKFYYLTILEMRWPLFHWISHSRWILFNSRKMKYELLLDRITHFLAIDSIVLNMKSFQMAKIWSAQIYAKWKCACVCVRVYGSVLRFWFFAVIILNLSKLP